jgi:decaprenylphospho-beta-D-ribofuranose 2-oxidase
VIAQVHGWGRFPRVDAKLHTPLSESAFVHQVASCACAIPRGLGRSYGDSALAPHVLSTLGLDHFQDFDPQSGTLTCQGGATLDDILRTFVPQGWFPPVTPGTRFVTVGGAIASDVHGKNHHVGGTFGQYVRGIVLLLGDGQRVTTSPTEHPDLFHATCGGMGLTGVILSATIQLKRIQASDVIETIIKAPNLEAVLDGLDGHSASYSVAWIDCMAQGSSLGRGLLRLGEHATDGALLVQASKTARVPADMPSGLLNCATARAFNSLYYGRARRTHRQRIAFEPFFYPLDAIADWNRLYGMSGFVQYQFVLPKSAGGAGLREVMERIVQSRQPSFLAVLKQFGPANSNLLSFPAEGYTLALDFKADKHVFDLLDALDRVVLHHGGRLYLAKDSRMSEATFKASYPRWQQFEEVRARWKSAGKFASLQSRRLGLQ